MRQLLGRTLVTLALGCFAGLHAFAQTPLPAATNLAQHGSASARQGAPLIMLVSVDGCSFCEKIRRQHLAPLQKAGAIVYQIHLDSDAALTDFAGAPTTQRALAQKLAVKAAPTVLFFNARGIQVAEPIVGALIDDFYAGYLDQAILTAKKALSPRS